LFFIHVQPIGLAQDGCQRSCAATEVGFLLHQVGKLALADAWIGLYTTAPPGRTESGSCATSITWPRTAEMPRR
jgi:hypothetical protein